MILLADVVGVSGRIRPEVAAVAERQALLGGACTRGGQTAALVPLDADVVEIRVWKRESLSLVLVAVGRWLVAVGDVGAGRLPGLSQWPTHSGQHGLGPCGEEGRPALLHLPCRDESLLGPPPVAVLLKHIVAKRSQHASTPVEMCSVGLTVLSLLEEARNGLHRFIPGMNVGHRGPHGPEGQLEFPYLLNQGRDLIPALGPLEGQDLGRAARHAEVLQTKVAAARVGNGGPALAGDTAAEAKATHVVGRQRLVAAVAQLLPGGQPHGLG